MLSFLLSASFWDSVIRLSGPIALASLAALVCSRSGVLYVGVEGVMVIAAFFAMAAALVTNSLILGLACGILAGVAASLLMGLFSMILRMGDIVGGLMVHIGALGITGFLSRQWFPLGMTLGQPGLRAGSKAAFGDLTDPILHQPLLIYVGLATIFAIELFLRTRWGLLLRTSGESIRVARALGIHLRALRFGALGTAGVLAGLAGATLSLVIAGSFEPDMVNGRGFIALACVMLGGWRALGVVAAATLFAGSDAFQIRLTAAAGLGQGIALLPYVLTLLAMALLWGRSQGPAEEGRGLEALEQL